LLPVLRLATLLLPLTEAPPGTDVVEAAEPICFGVLFVLFFFLSGFCLGVRGKGMDRVLLLWLVDVLDDGVVVLRGVFVLLPRSRGTGGGGMTGRSSLYSSSSSSSSSLREFRIGS
jgi:uncharacterized membrane protein YgcG